MKKHLLILFAALLSIAASAQTKVEIDGVWYNLSKKAKQAVITSPDGYHYSGSITIPTTVTYEDVECNVTGIENFAFNYGTSLTDVHISSLEFWCNLDFSSAGNNPIYYAENLYLNGELVTELIIPSTVTAIKDYTFACCRSLTSITIPESTTNIERSAFYYCDGITSITVSAGNAIYDSRNKCNAIIETSNNTLIVGCSTTIIPNDVTSIGERAFAYCESLTTITIPESVTSIGEWAFSGCSSLTAINIPENSQLTSIGGGAFYGCSSLTTITIPEGVTSIGGDAFGGCSNLTNINIPKGVTNIMGYTFYECSNLTTITIPESVTSIGLSAFALCPELTDIYCYAENVPSAEGPFWGSYPEYATLHVPASALDAYKTTAPWSSFGNSVELGAAITRITLDKTSATLTEGEELTLTITTTPDDADRNLISWSSSNPSVATVDNNGKVTAVAPGTATITAMANDGSGVSASCEIVVNELILGKCSTPTISYVDGKISLACETEGTTIKSSVSDNNTGDYEVTEYNIIPTYTITAYATKEHYENSDEVRLTLCWIPCSEEHEENNEEKDEEEKGEDKETNGILTIPSNPVFISTQGGTITVSGLAAGTEVAAYSTAGTSLATATATDGTATLDTGLEAGNIAIVKIGEHSIKIVIK